MGFEPTTASLEGWNSTTELRPQHQNNPLLLDFLEKCKFLEASLFCRCVIINLPDMVGRQGFEPWKPMAADLQSAPVDHLGTCPFDQVGPFSTQTVFELHHGN